MLQSNDAVNGLRIVAGIELAMLMAGLTAIAVWKISRGVRQWFLHSAAREGMPGGGAPAAMRWQLLIVTLVAAVAYLGQLPAAIGSGKLPDVPDFALGLLACSQAVYLGTAACTLLRRFLIARRGEER